MLFRRRSERPEVAAHASEGEQEAVLLDGASGLCQLWYFQRRLRGEVARCARHGRPFTVVLLELQLLPGETVPDEVILRAGEVILNGLRQTDLAARTDRTSFVALLVEATSAAARPVAHRLKSDLTLRVRGATGRWKAGTAAFPDDGVDADTLLQVAARRLREDSHPAS